MVPHNSALMLALIVNGALLPAAIDGVILRHSTVQEDAPGNNLADLSLLRRAVHAASMEEALQEQQYAVRRAAGSSRRPLITGCYSECGWQDQACITQCQVCVEMQRCKTVMGKKCRRCRLQALKAKHMRKKKKADNMMFDSGGIASQHDHVRMHLFGAKLEALDAERQLRRARGEVLKAQRQAEWSMEESSDVAARLHEARRVLERKERELQDTKVLNAKALKMARSEVSDKRAELKKTEARLVKAASRSKFVRQKFRYSRNRERWQRIWPSVRDAHNKLQAKANYQKATVKRLKDDLHKRETKARFMERGLTRENNKARQLVDEDNSRLHAAHAMERLLREQLEKAKEAYRKAASKSQKREATAAALRRDLNKHPLPTHTDLVKEYKLNVTTESS
mmetsp:Transcript_15364/g.30250  ORF Transcript_15364/g.30250 Transcript_15364/m.30250 type:complete len:397 (-) Transcript_15364:71-1261(-)